MLLVLLAVAGECFPLTIPRSEKPRILYENGDFNIEMSGLIKADSYFGFSSTFLRHHIHDKLFYNVTTIDLNVTTHSPGVTSVLGIRDRVYWGNKRLTSTDRMSLVIFDATQSVHSHSIANMIWVREVWVKADIGTLCKIENSPLSFTIGAFPFQLGRGISLGYAYRVNSLSIDYFQDTVVDQYNWGAKLSGALKDSLFQYDAYISIINNLSTSLAETNEPVYKQAFGESKKTPALGAGNIRFITAAHCMFKPMDNGFQKLTFDPYIMHYHAPDQKVEYLFDAKMSLTTAGFAVELVTPHFEFGFDCASNFGHQSVLGWDRNSIQISNQGGYVTHTYTDVLTVDPTIQEPGDDDVAIFDPSNTAYTLAVSTVTPGTVSNGTPIEGTPFYNSLTRFRDPYTTKLRGYMWVGDMTFWVIPRLFSLNTTWGMASGDANPNKVNLLDPLSAKIDGTYNGFVPVMEMYAGSRVQSYFYMTSGLVPLLASNNVNSYFSYGVDALSNVIFWGASVKRQGEHNGKKWMIMPNMIMFWQDYKVGKFDVIRGVTTDVPSAPYKGLEANIFLQSQLTKDLSLTAGFAMFVPGAFFFDVLGLPQFPEVAKNLVTALKAGASLSDLPLLGNETVYSGIVALTYTF